MGSLRVLRVTRNLIPNFSSCLDKTRIMVAELRKSSSNFSILSSKFTSTTPPPPLFQVCLHNRCHCRLRIHDPIATPPANNAIPHHAQALFPTNSTSTAFFELKSTARFAARPTKEEARHRNSATERNESKLKLEFPPPPPATTTTSSLVVALSLSLSVG